MSACGVFAFSLSERKVRRSSTHSSGGSGPEASPAQPGKALSPEPLHGRGQWISTRENRDHTSERKPEGRWWGLARLLQCSYHHLHPSWEHTPSDLAVLSSRHCLFLPTSKMYFQNYFLQVYNEVWPHPSSIPFSSPMPLPLEYVLFPTRPSYFRVLLKTNLSLIRVAHAWVIS